jgi:outer membrane protein OmpA-like peptidoglycan-associated protein
MKGCDSQTPVASEETGTMRMPPAATPAETPEQVALTLPGGAAIYARKGGVEEQLINFLNDPSTKGSKDAWFDFDNLNFKTGSAELTDESRVQVGNLVAILNAYPRLKVKIGGYTDKTGDSLTNLQLSQQRADAVVKALQTEGAGASQVLGAEGYGLQFAHAAADAPDEQRKLDRRIALCVREK